MRRKAVPDAAAMSERAANLRGTALVAASALIWSSGGLIVRSISAADSWTIVFWRSLTAAAFLLGLLAWQTRGRAWQALAGMGRAGWGVALAFACASIALIVALRLTTVADVLIIMSTAPMFAAAFGWLFLGERVSSLTLMTIAATVVGIVVIVWNGLAAWSPASLLGEAVALLIALGYAVAIVITRHNSHVAMTPATLVGVTIAAVVALPLATPWPVTPHDGALLVTFGALQLGLGLAAFAAGARLIPAAQTALLGTLEPILGPLWVWLFAGEAPGAAALVGGAIVLASVTLHTLAESRNTASEPRPAT